MFYLKQWAGDDGKLWEYKERYRGVLPRRVFADSTGYRHGLYSVPGMPPEKRQYVETTYMSWVDNHAAVALKAMLDESRLALDFPLRFKVAWARFLFSLTFRSPNVIKRLQVQMDEQVAGGAIRQPEIPFVAAEVFPSMLQSKTVIRELISMTWVTGRLYHADQPLLTSDRPIIMTNGLVQPEAHIVLPISPRIFFLAYRTEAVFNHIAAKSQKELAAQINDHVTRQAIDFVYAFDDSQTDFIQKRLGQRARSTPLG